jgi:L-alanine-DL-glutamate epimerase-like enolase superfamily enzyme
LRAAAGSSGPGGIFMLALSAIDIALWDIKGKALNLSVAALLGAKRTRVPTYASGAMMRHFSLAEVEKAAATLVNRGFTQMKTQLALPGETSTEREVERIRVTRNAIGPGIALMCDINQRWSVEEAVRIGHRIEEFNLDWLEDVTAHDDYAGLAQVTARLTTPVAGGEYVYGITPFRHMLEARSVDIAMIDLFRVGGITQWMKVAGMAEAFNIPVVSHLVPEVHVHLIAAAPNGRVVEYMPWTAGLFEAPPLPDRGMLTVPSQPGLGLRWAPEVVKRLAATD